MNSVVIKIGSQSGETLVNTVFPYSYGNLLDESLDEANFSIVLSTKQKLAMQTKLTAVITNDTKTYTRTYVVASDAVEEKPLGSGKYTHLLYLLEETKLLESITCGELAFTNTKSQAFADDTFVVVET
jgi:hypothetical protein